MKRWLCIVLILLLLTGCGAPETIVGTWEAEMTVSVLGIDQPGTEAPAVTRFIFRKDGTGSWGTEISGGSYPEAVREFSYSLEEDVLTLTFAQEDSPTRFTAVLSGDSLTLENPRGSFLLTRTK